MSDYAASPDCRCSYKHKREGADEIQTFEMCALHSAAPKLLDAALEALGYLRAVSLPPYAADIPEKLRAACAEALGEAS